MFIFEGKNKSICIFKIKVMISYISVTDKFQLRFTHENVQGTFDSRTKFRQITKINK